jgi:phosphinothricin acetyltransferase
MAPSTKPISFREVTRESLGKLAEIMNHYIEYTTVSFYTKPLSVEDMREKVFFEHPASRSFLIMQEGEIIGYCAVSPWKKQEAYRHTGEINVYLSPEKTAKGIGSIAIEYLIGHARANDIHTLIAGLCSENYPSKRLFEKNGFVQCAHFKAVGRKFGRVLDTVYFQRAINVD